MQTKEVIQCSIKVLTALICIIVFLVQAGTIFVAVMERPTTTLVENVLNKKLQFPILTFCPDKGFKTKGFFYKKEDFERNKYKLEDIFTDEFVGKLNESFYWSETWSVFKGACYSFEFLDFSVGFSLKQVYFDLKKSAPNLNLLIHEKGYEMWVSEYIFPLSIEVLDLELESKHDIWYSDVLLKKVESISIKNCKNEDYNKCARTGMVHDMIKRGVECLPSYFWPSLDPKSEHFSVCNGSRTQADESYKKVIEVWSDFIRQPEHYNCTRPCRKTTYNPRMIHMHKMADFNDYGKDKGRSVTVTFESMHVISYKEHFLYDASNIFSSVGGSVGLLSGLSIYSIVSLLTDTICNFF